MLTQLTRYIARRHARNRAIDELSALTDHDLADIGIHRSQILSYVEG
ncbi:MAG: DUF1127 domain-containing protein, partial [Pseudomonadota bacterium]